jgi:NAD(P)-dependent dehydrogenase (short-subunit alcohol dehydrogenase family)
MKEVVVVTGASAGIGRAIARAFGEQQARVALLARGREGLEGARSEIEASGGEALVIPTDVANYDEVEAAAAEVEERWGHIDIWVNDAMVTIFSPFMDIAPEDYKRATEVSYLGYVWGTQAALKRMKPRNKGTIIQVGSAMAYRSIPLQSAYCGAKAAIRGFTDSIRSELIHDNSDVHICMVQLSAFNTPQFDWGRTTLHKQPQPMPPIFQPEMAAEAVVWAAHHRRRELWVGSPAIEAIAGNRLLAPVLDHVLASKGYSGQHTDEPLPPDRPDNLYEPVPGDRGAHGRFDERAKSSSPQLWADTHRGLLAGALLVVTAGVLIGQLGSGSSHAARY